MIRRQVFLHAACVCHLYLKFSSLSTYSSCEPPDGSSCSISSAGPFVQLICRDVIDLMLARSRMNALFASRRRHLSGISFPALAWLTIGGLSTGCRKPWKA